MKTVIFVWTLTPCNYKKTETDNFWGIGDIIRGMLSVGTICETNNCDYFIDVRYHNICDYLQIVHHPYENIVDENIKKIPFITGNVLQSYIQTSQSNIILLMSNAPMKTPPGKNALCTIKMCFNKSDNFNKIYNTRIGHLTMSKPYNILHIRMGDESLVQKKKSENIPYIYNNIVKKHCTLESILITDSSELKEFIKCNDQSIRIYNSNNTCHIGICDQDIIDTVIEFFLVRQSKQIKTYSVYSWVSGFVLYPSIIDNIPLQAIK